MMPLSDRIGAICMLPELYPDYKSNMITVCSAILTSHVPSLHATKALQHSPSFSVSRVSSVFCHHVYHPSIPLLCRSP